MTLNTLPEIDNNPRPPVLILKDDSLRWVSSNEATRLKNALDNAYNVAWEAWGEGERENSMDVEDVLQFVIREGYTKIGGYVACIEDGVEEQHYLFCTSDGEHVFITPVLWDEGSLYLHHIDTSHCDVEGDNCLLYLESDEELQLADQKQLICRDGKGYHVQVTLWRSIVCQFTDDRGVLDEEKLRALWLAKVS